MVTLHGEAEKFALFTDGSRAVIIDKKLNVVEDVGHIADLSVAFPWRTSFSTVENIHVELAENALADLSIETLTAAGGNRLYTIPKAAQEEAKRALEWRKEYQRGGTPVGLNTARTLANGGQIGLKKVRHIAKYFPRHEVDKKAKGYKPGQDGYPSNGRIAWALWGGDAAWRWAKAIVERENKKPVKSDGSVEYDDLDAQQLIGYDSDINVFEMAKSLENSDYAIDFVARTRLDGTGIDRLYMVDQYGSAYVWDSGLWDDLGLVDADIYSYDRALDDPYDAVEKNHVLIDIDSAVVLSAHLQESPFKSVSLSDLNEHEATLVAAAANEIDWVVVDAAMIADGAMGEQEQDGEYTPEERARNARRQVRDKSGKFAKVGGRVVVDGNPETTGRITGINPSTGSVTVEMDDGSTQDVAASRTQAENTFVPIARETNPDEQKPLDTSGILAQPRAPIDRPLAVIPGGLPALGSEDLRQIIADFPAWVQSQRQAPGYAGPSAAPAAPGDLAPKHQKSDYLKDLEEKTGTSLYTDSATEHPLLQNFFAKKKKNALYYNPITSAGENKPTTIREAAAESEGLGEPLTPETSDVQPMYLAIVSPDDPAAVMDLVSVVPAATNSTSPMTFKRVEGKWVQDEQILADLKSATPPPVVALSGEAYADVLSQVDQTVAASGFYMYSTSDVDVVLSALQLANCNPLVAVGVEGGLDRNRGNAEKLRRYWLYGRGALKIRWNTPGDWTRCYRHLRKYMGPRAKGYCSLRHKEATGVWPGSRFNIGKKNIRGSAYDSYAVADEWQVIENLRLRAALLSAKEKFALVSSASDTYGARFTIPLVIPEETETGDGRIFKKDAIAMREMPLPLLWQIKTGDGHNGSVVVGRIDGMERTDGGVGNAYGVFDTGPYGREAERLVRNGFISGVSADLDQFEASEEDEDGDAIDLIEEISDKDLGKNKKKKKEKIGGNKIKVDKARVMAVTIVPKPAFEECKIFIEESVYGTEPQEDEMEFLQDGVYTDDVDVSDAEALVACGMVASSIPTVPPATWFTDPKLAGPTPLTVDDNGRVFGHIAAWNTNHIGMSYGTRPPRSRSSYSYFHTGVVRADDGNDYTVGQLTLAGGHASLEASAAEAARHYDDTGSAIADVHAGEDAYGIWVAGALRPSASPEQIRALRASAPSGDWRPIGGSLELVAVCQVNVPGFPIARARVASGQVYALVAAGAMTLAKMKNDPVKDLSSRLEQLEIKVGVKADPTVLAARATEARAKFAALKEEENSSLTAKAEELSSRVRSAEPYDSLGYISMKTRKKLAQDGKALPDGSYPIRNVAELKDAIQAYGRSKPGKRAAVRRHIMKRARGLDRADLIPEKWKSAGLIDDDVVADIKQRAAAALSSLDKDGDTPKE